MLEYGIIHSNLKCAHSLWLLKRGSFQNPCIVLEDTLFTVANWEDQSKEDLDQNSVKGEIRLPIFLFRRQASLQNHQVLSQTNWNILILSQKNQKIYIGGGTPS